MNDSDDLNMMISDCTWQEIQEMFKSDSDNATKQVYFSGRKYQCSFIGLHCVGAYCLS